MIRNVTSAPCVSALVLVTILSSASVASGQDDRAAPGGSEPDRPIIHQTSDSVAGQVVAAGKMVAVFEVAPDGDSRGREPIVVVHEAALREAAGRHGKLELSHLPLEPNRLVTLEVEPLRVVGPKTRFVVGRKDGPDRPFPYDTSQVFSFHGTVQGHPNSSVVLFSSPRGVRGHIDLGPSDQRFKISSVDAAGKPLGPGLAIVRPVDRNADPLPDVPLCGRDTTPTVAGCCFEPSSGEVFNKRLKGVEIAVETDFDLYENFNDPTAATDYVVELIARTNAIFIRDIDTRFEMVYLRLFDNPANEPAFMADPDPLNGYVNFWSANMGGVARDTATFLSGRRDLPYGGIAYIGAVCGSFAYCVCGYLSGFPDPTRPNSGDYDLGVVAHELGHNFNACHTPDYCPFIDRCYPPPIFPQRGTMMSYCSQTVSGGNLVTDLWYHTRLRRVMRSFVENNAFCASDDCNQNGEDDAVEIAGGADDVNGNGVIDECEDCNANGVLDPTEIALNPGLDQNGNGVPDGCEPDCNANGSPDDLDIALKFSLDVWGNGVPDECDPDCDGDGTADYDQIQASLPLDIDRNIVLDSCQDCDGDGTNDLVELMGARNAWVASDVLNYIGEYHAISGVRVKTSPLGQVSAAQDLIIAPGDRVLVTSSSNDKVVAYHAITGAYLSDFVPAGSGGLDYPTGLVIGPNGNLFLCSRNTNSVLQYNGTSGAFAGAFVAAGAGGLTAPFGLAFGPSGNLYVTSGGNQVLEYNGGSGAFVRVFVSAANNGGLSGARGMLFKPDGNLLVASYNSDALLQYNGSTGAFLGKWNSGGTASALYLDGPWGVRLGPTGNVFASRDLPANDDHPDQEPQPPHLAPLHVTSARIMEFDIRNGKYVRSFVVGDDTGLRSPTGFDFMPGTFDCNFNMLPDSCDLADQTSADCNDNNVPDECDTASGTSSDCNVNSIPDECEPLGTDCNNNGIRDDCDTASGTSRDCNENLIPDECEVLDDCNGNGIGDGCDIADCTADPACGDCNANTVPDSCDISACGGAPACADCNANGVPDGCDIASGAPDLDGNGVPDACEAVPPSPPVSDPTGLDKSRFLSFSVPASASAGGADTALRVTLDSLHHVDPPYTGAASTPFVGCEGKVRWSGPPAVYLEAQSVPVPFVASQAQSTPYYRDWSAFRSCTDNAAPFEYGVNFNQAMPLKLCETDADCVIGLCSMAPVACYSSSDCPPNGGICQNIANHGEVCTRSIDPILHLTGSSIVPSSRYTVENVAAICQDNEANCTFVSAALPVRTGRWGDVVDAFQLSCPEINTPTCNTTTCSAINCTTQPDAQDFGSLVNKFKSLLGSPIKARAFLAGDPAGVIDLTTDFAFIHISVGVDAFKGNAYPYTPECLTNP